jgi:homogentisate 1,2-dioxygenase
MPLFYHKLGKIPHKRHIRFSETRRPLYYEQLLAMIGFECIQIPITSNRPTMAKEIRGSYSVKPEIALETILKSYRLKGSKSPHNPITRQQNDRISQQ